MGKSVKEWLKIAKYDLETAKAMLEKGRYLYVLFMCQQAVEKILKAIYNKHKKEFAPRTHNLTYLGDILNLEMDEKKKEFLAELNQFYLGSRYPGEQKELSEAIDKHKARFYWRKTKEVFQWLEDILQSEK